MNINIISYLNIIIYKKKNILKKYIVFIIINNNIRNHFDFMNALLFAAIIAKLFKLVGYIPIIIN